MANYAGFQKHLSDTLNEIKNAGLYKGHLDKCANAFIKIGKKIKIVK